jgi:AraC-like DNA-binding protein
MTAGGSVILLDTAEVAPRDRDEVIRTAMLSVSVPTEVTLTDSPDETWARMDFWDFGDTNLFASSSSSFRLARSRRHLAMEGVPLVALAVQTAATAGFEQCGQEYTVRPGELMINDLTAAYDYGWDGDGGSCAFQVSHEQLGLPVDVTRAAARRLPASPLYDLTRTHLAYLYRHRDELEGGPAGRHLGRATLELTRALIVSASGATTVPYDSTAELREGAIAYIDLHRSNPALTPAAIAAAQHVSVRQLYKAFARAGLSVEQTIVGLRLEAARRELARPANASLTVDAIARRCGFSNLSHFSRRFRQRYGVTPKQWQQRAR